MKPNKRVRQMQQAMKDHGYAVVVDGVLGNATLAIVKDLLRRAPKPKPTHTQTQLPWLEEAFKWDNLREIKGVQHNSQIQQWLRALGAWWNDDETPWCGTFVAHCLSTTKRGIPHHWYRAKAYATYGTRLGTPAYGCIGVLHRKGGGHVCFIVGESQCGKYLIGYGGNQGNKVSMRRFPRKRFMAYVWPNKADGVQTKPFESRYKLPVYTENLTISTSES